MTATDRESVERLAVFYDEHAATLESVAHLFKEDGGHAVAVAASARQQAEDTAATLRALLVEREAARAAEAEWRRMATLAMDARK